MYRFSTRPTAPLRSLCSTESLKKACHSAIDGRFWLNSRNPGHTFLRVSTYLPYWCVTTDLRKEHLGRWFSQNLGQAIFGIPGLPAGLQPPDDLSIFMSAGGATRRKKNSPTGFPFPSLSDSDFPAGRAKRDTVSTATKRNTKRRRESILLPLRGDLWANRFFRRERERERERRMANDIRA